MTEKDMINVIRRFYQILLSDHYLENVLEAIPKVLEKLDSEIMAKTHTGLRKDLCIAKAVLDKIA